MAETYNENLNKVLRLTREMLATADEGDRDRNDDSCGILYGILRDMAYRLRTVTEEECQKHKLLKLTRRWKKRWNPWPGSWPASGRAEHRSPSWMEST